MHQQNQLIGERPFLAKLYFVLFLRKCWSGEGAEAHYYLDQAIRFSPSIAFKFEDLIVEWIVKQTDGLHMERVDSVLDNLPQELKKPFRFRQRILGKLYIARAFEDYQHWQRANTIHDILKGWYLAPAFLKNYGVLAAFFKSLFNIHDTNAQPASAQEESSLSLDPILHYLELALGSLIHHIEPVTTGTSNERIFIVQNATDNYILRILEAGNKPLKLRMAIAELLSTAQLPVPAILASSLTSPGITGDLEWLLEEDISGTWFTPELMNQEEILQGLRELGHYLHQLHHIETKGFGSILFPDLQAPYPTFAAWLDSRQYSILEACLSGAIPETVLESIDAADRFLRDTYQGPPVLCHGDLSNENILIDHGQVRAIIDWEDMKGNDPAYDLAVYFTGMIDEWYPSLELQVLNTILQTYPVENPDLFYQRIIAHRILFIASWIKWLTSQGAHLQTMSQELLHLLEDYRSFSYPKMVVG